MQRALATLALAAAAFTSTMAHGQPAVPHITYAAMDLNGNGRLPFYLRNPQDSSITSYQMRFGTGSPPTFNAWGTATWIANLPDGELVSTVRSLAAGARSAVEVRAVNSVGAGPATRVWIRNPAMPHATVNIPDAVLRSVMFVGAHTRVRGSGNLAAANNFSNSGIVDLTGINFRVNTQTLSLADNMISDISPLLLLPDLGPAPHCGNCRTSSLPREQWNNENTMTGGLLSVDLRGNPLSEASVYTHIPALQAAGVVVFYDRPPPPPPPNEPPQPTGTIDALSLETGQSVAFAGRDYFNDSDDYILTFSGSSSNPAVATVEVGDWDTLTLTAVAEGLAEVTLSATDPGGSSASLSFVVTVGNPASLGGAGELSAFASAPEGGIVQLNVSLAKPRDADVALTWVIGIDDDPATADADANDHGGAGGDVVIPAGETRAAINIVIADDADIEPAREVFVVSLTPQDGLGLGVATATVHIEEGVCDRTPQVADELRGVRDCAAVTSGRTRTPRVGSP